MNPKIEFKDLKVGQIFNTRRSCSVTVKRIKNHNEIIVKFNDGHGYRCSVYLTSLNSGHILNPYEPSICGAGYLGVGRHKTYHGRAGDKLVINKTYAVWSKTVRKCFEAGSEYTIDRRWLNYQVFARWYEKQITPDCRLFLTTKLISPTNRHYGPQTAHVIPDIIAKNVFRIRHNSHPFPSGVSQPNLHLKRYRMVFNTKGYGTINSTHDTVEAASLAYQREVVKSVHRSAETFKDTIEPKVYELLRNWTYTIY